MLYLAERLARQETEADRQEFLKGVLGVNRVNVQSFAAGWISGSLLRKSFK